MTPEDPLGDVSPGIPWVDGLQGFHLAVSG
jgi:hypothetical protein